MNSEPVGIGTSTVEVPNISTHAISILVGDRELFLPYDDFPWFRDAPISKIVNVEEPTRENFYWPDLDIDFGLQTIEHPERFPLKESIVLLGLLSPALLTSCKYLTLLLPLGITKQSRGIPLAPDA